MIQGDLNGTQTTTMANFAKARNAVDQRPTIAVEIQDERVSVPWRKMPGDEHLAVIRQEAQLFDPAHTVLGRTGETPTRETRKTARKDSQADDRQDIDCRSNRSLSPASLARNKAVGQTNLDKR